MFTAVIACGAPDPNRRLMMSRQAAVALAIAIASLAAKADPVSDWMEFGRAVIRAANAAPGPEHERAQTQMALAMFEAANAIDRRYESYLGMPPAVGQASQEAAVATAAYIVLLAHFPAQKQSLDDNHAIALEAVKSTVSRDAGRNIGEDAARRALKLGLIDPSVQQRPYRPRAIPGVWAATQLPTIAPYEIAFKPWILPSADVVRPAPPPALTSKVWADAYEEVRRLGGKDSKERTAHQTLMARFRITPDLMPTFRSVAEGAGRSVVQNARMFALVEMITDDAGMAVGEAKLHYNFWRPIAAIRNGDEDGNPATEPDRGWTPLINTPNFPEYPCAHCVYAAAVAEVMKTETGPSPREGVRVSSRSLPTSAIQVLPSWDEWVTEVSMSRLLGGVHYRFSNVAGEELGRTVARLGLDKIMRPLAR